MLAGVLPDLHVQKGDQSAWSTPSGQPYDISLLIENIGTAPVRALSKWYLAVYLSIDALLDPFDTKLVSIEVTDAIGVNSTVQRQLSLFIPFDLPTLTYYLIAGKLLSFEYNSESYTEEHSSKKFIQSHKCKKPYSEIYQSSSVHENEGLKNN